MTEKRAVIAIDIGGSTTKMALIDAEGELRHWRSFATRGPEAAVFLEEILAAIREILSEALQPVLGVSVAMAGFVNREGALAYNPNLAWLEHAPLAAVIRDALHLPVFVEADSNAACAAEYIFGQGRGASRFLCLTGGTGLGVGMVIDGRLLRIAHGCMGDAGHIILSPAGPLCSCGGRGCAEAFLSTASLGRRYAQECGGDATFRSLVDASQRNESIALGLLAEAGQWLGMAAASLSSVFFPDRIAVAGGLCLAGDAFFVAATTALQDYGGSFPLADLSLVRASTGEHATILGAAACFFYPVLLG
jgi:glucokinase